MEEGPDDDLTFQFDVNPLTILKLELVGKILCHPTMLPSESKWWIDKLFKTTGWLIYNFQKDWNERVEEIRSNDPKKLKEKGLWGVVGEIWD